MTPDLKYRRRYCRENPDMVVSLLGRELTALVDTIEEQERQIQKLRGRLRRQRGKENP